MDQIPEDLRLAIEAKKKQVESLSFLDFTVLDVVGEQEESDGTEEEEETT